jgi:hypothetical protein
MATMTYRTTFSLDESTVVRIKNLAALWDVSQAEVIRRAVSGAQAAASTPSQATAFQNFLQSGNGLNANIASQYLEEVRESRKRWRNE